MPSYWIKALITLSSLSVSAAIHAQALFVTPQDFTLNQSCNAYDSIKKESNPVLLQADTTYLSLGENKAEAATHAYLDVHGKKKWVKLACGSYANSRPGFKTATDTHQGNSQNPQNPRSLHRSTCLKFFDNETNPVKTRTGFKDVTPPAPPLNKFDNDVLNFCGAPGNITTAQGFKSLMKSNPDVLKRLFVFTGGKVFQEKPQQSDIDHYLNDLAEAWYSLHGFDHIFCGEKSGRSIGGLHFHGRYQQLEKSGAICRMNNFGNNEVAEGTVYSMGVEMTLASNEVLRHSIKGFGLTLNASDMLLSATKAFSENHTGSNKSEHCILKLNDGPANYDMVSVRRNNGIRTYYPDATPEQNRPCANKIVLPL